MRFVEIHREVFLLEDQRSHGYNVMSRHLSSVSRTKADGGDDRGTMNDTPWASQMVATPSMRYRGIDPGRLGPGVDDGIGSRRGFGSSL